MSIARADLESLKSRTHHARACVQERGRARGGRERAIGRDGGGLRDGHGPLCHEKWAVGQRILRAGGFGAFSKLSP